MPIIGVSFRKEDKYMDFHALMSPIKIGTMEIKNRLVVPPMATGLAQPDGSPTDGHVAYWEERAKGGYGLLIVEATAVDPLGKGSPWDEPGIWDDRFIPAWEKVTEAAHKYGAKIALQLHHAGRQTTHDKIGGQPVAPSPIPCPVEREMPHELTTEEVYDLIEKFGDAARRARDAGFDAVEVHGAHGYLIAQFMSPYSNKRMDEFGGGFMARMKFPVEIIKNIRSKVGNGYPVIFRLSGDEYVPGGRDIEDSKLVARVMEEAGFDAIHVSAGVYASTQYIIAPAAVPPAFNVRAAEEIKKSVNIPVIAVGRIGDPTLAESIIEAGRADMIAMGRSSLADPELPNKVAAGRTGEISPCIGCMQACAGYLFDPTKENISCLVNPFTGRERELKIEKAAEPKKVMVIGGVPFAAVIHIDGGVPNNNNNVAPCFVTGNFAHLIEILKNFQKRLVHRVLREALVVQDAVCDVEHEFSVCKVKRFEFAFFFLAVKHRQIYREHLRPSLLRDLCFSTRGFACSLRPESRALMQLPAATSYTSWKILSSGCI